MRSALSFDNMPTDKFTIAAPFLYIHMHDILPWACDPLLLKSELVTVESEHPNNVLQGLQ